MKNNLDPITTAILMHCLGAPARLKNLQQTIPRSSLYRRTNELVREGLLEKRGDRYVATPAGERAVRAPEPDAPVDTNIENAVLEAFPMFRYLPTPLHWDATLLIIGAVTSRQHLNQDDSLPGFALVGPPMVWKTKTAEALLAMVGAPPENLVFSPAEGGRSLFVRKDARGRTQTIRQILQALLAVFDEYHRARREVKALIGAYLHGKREIPFENSTLELRPTPVILLNPVKPSGTILERLGVDEAQFRRLVVFDLQGVIIPEAIEDKGTEHLKEIRRQSPIELKAPAGLSAGSRDRIKAAIKAVVLRKEHLRFIDFSMIASIVEGLTGYLGEEMAVLAGTLAYARSLASIGFATPGWRTAVTQALGGPAVARTAPAAPPRVPMTSNPLDYQANLSRLYSALLATGRTHQDLPKVLDDHSALVALLRALDVPPVKFFGLARELLGDGDGIEWLRAHIADFVKFGYFVLRGGMQDGQYCVSSALVKQAKPLQLKQDEWWYFYDALQGLAWDEKAESQSG